MGLVETFEMGLVETWNGVSWNRNRVSRNMFQLTPIHDNYNYMAQSQAALPHVA